MQNWSKGKKTFMIFATLLLTITNTASSYANNVCLPYFLNIIDAYDFYAFYAAIASVGMMTALPLVGSMSAKLGAKTVIIVGLIGQFATRLALGQVMDPVAFGVLYCIMGFFGGMFMSAPYSVMAELVTPQERPKYFGFITAASAFGALVGPLLTGAVIDSMGPGMGMLVYVVFAVIPLIAYLMFYPNTKRPGTKFDFPGMFTFVIFVLALVLWLSLGGKMFPFASPLGIGMPVVAAAALILLLKREKKIENPAVPVKMFAYKRFRITFIVQCMVVAYATCAAAYGIRYAIEVMNLSATVSSTVTMPQTIVQFILGLFMGALVGKSFKKRFRPFALIGIVCYIIGLMIFFTLSPASPVFIIYLATGIGGIGQAVVQATFAAFYQSELKPEDIRSAQGMYQFASTGGSSVFTAVIGVAMNLGMTLQGAFLLGSIWIGVGLVVAFIGFRFPKEEIEAEAAAQKAQ